MSQLFLRQFLCWPILGFFGRGVRLCIKERWCCTNFIPSRYFFHSKKRGRMCAGAYPIFKKTDQLGTSSLVHIEGNLDTTMCPVQALKQYLQIRPVWTAQPLFIHFDSEVLTRHQVNSILKWAVGTIGLPPNDFSRHSFRIGAATSAAMQGIQDEDIKSMGRWKSGAFRSYIRPHRLLSFI